MFCSSDIFSGVTWSLHEETKEHKKHFMGNNMHADVYVKMKGILRCEIV
jgi:hypothetical protein